MPLNQVDYLLYAYKICSNLLHTNNKYPSSIDRLLPDIILNSLNH